MEMQSVDSSNIECIGYDLGTNILRVQFKKSGDYDYHNVPEHVFDELKNAASVGTYFNAEIKNSYSFTKI
jgi:hypothetical protein